MLLSGTAVDLDVMLERTGLGAEVWRGTGEDGRSVRVELQRDAAPVHRHLDVPGTVALARRLADQPGVLPVLTAGRTEDGVGYLVRLWPDGGALADRVPTSDLGWLPAIADALDLLHERHLLHLDVRPGTVVFLDGRAHLAGPSFFRFDGDPGPHVISQEEIQRSLAAVAPEGHGRSTRRADVYGLAATAYLALAGQPHRPTDDRPAGQAPTDAGTAQGADVGPLLAVGVPAHAAAAIVAGLAPRPADRPGTAGELAAAISGAPADGSPPRQRASEGDPDALAIGEAHLEHGRIEEAGRWLQASSRGGSAEGHRAFDRWLAAWAHPLAASAWFRPLAEAGDEIAAERLVAALERSGENARELAGWLGRRAAAGDAGAMRRLGVLQHRRGLVEEGLFWLRSAADEDDVEGMYRLGSLWHLLGHRRKAEAWLRRAARLGSTAARDELTTMR